MLDYHLQVILGHADIRTTQQTYYKAKPEVLSGSMLAAVERMKENGTIIPIDAKKRGLKRNKTMAVNE